jgi:hypothetical protein
MVCILGAAYSTWSHALQRCSHTGPAVRNRSISSPVRGSASSVCMLVELLRWSPYPMQIRPRSTTGGTELFHLQRVAARCASISRREAPKSALGTPPFTSRNTTSTLSNIHAGTSAFPVFERRRITAPARSRLPLGRVLRCGFEVHTTYRRQRYRHFTGSDRCDDGSVPLRLYSMQTEETGASGSISRATYHGAAVECRILGVRRERRGFRIQAESIN